MTNFLVNLFLILMKLDRHCSVRNRDRIDTGVSARGGDLIANDLLDGATPFCLLIVCQRKRSCCGFGHRRVDIAVRCCHGDDNASREYHSKRSLDACVGNDLTILQTHASDRNIVLICRRDDLIDHCANLGFAEGNRVLSDAGWISRRRSCGWRHVGG